MKRWLWVLLLAFILFLIPTPVRATTPIDHYGVPEGFSIDSGQIQWIPQKDQIGIWHILVTVSDNDTPAQTASKELTISIYAVEDVNQDWNIDLLDLIIVGQHLGESGVPHFTGADVNLDGSVNLLDLIAVVSQIGLYV